MFCDFATQTQGKWILTGEHAVLRGYGALVFPIKQKKLTLTFEPTSTKLSADFSGDMGQEMHLLFWSVLERGQTLLGHSLNDLTGHFQIESNIPIGVGMGASAALCVAMARWFAAQQLLSTEAIQAFAQELEHLFHGQSSGLDILGVTATQGVYFQKGQGTMIHQQWQPTWFLSFCGQSGITSHCIKEVNQLWDHDKAKAEMIDERMQQAVNKAKEALEHATPDSIVTLTEAINEGSECFKQWGLVTEMLQKHMQFLTHQGALAVKPTGSGGGGYVLSLWNKPLPIMPFELIPV